MPTIGIHSKCTLKRYGVKGEGIHVWMDEPHKILGVNHRIYRHDPNTTPKEAMRMKEFLEKYTPAQIRDIVLDHIRRDMLNSKKSEKICLQCDKEFITNMPQQQVYCSIECRRESEKTRFRRKCLVCDKEFTSAYYLKKFCSLKCRKKHYQPDHYNRICLQCGKNFNRRNGKYCSMECWKKANKAIPVESTCEFCKKKVSIKK